MPIPSTGTPATFSGNVPASQAVSVNCNGATGLYVAIARRGGTVDVLTALTFNGVAVPIVRTGTHTAARWWVAYLANPSQGTFDLVATVSAAVNIGIVAVPILGSDVAAPYNEDPSTNGIDNAPTDTVEATSADLVLAMIRQSATTSFTPGGTASLVAEATTNGTHTVHVTSQPGAGATPNVVTAMLASSLDWNAHAMAIHPVAGAEATRHPRPQVRMRAGATRRLR